MARHHGHSYGEETVDVNVEEVMIESLYCRYFVRAFAALGIKTHVKDSHTLEHMSRTSHGFSERKTKSHHGQEIKKWDFRIRIYFAHVLSIRTVSSIYRERLGQTLNSSDVSKIEGTC